MSECNFLVIDWDFFFPNPNYSMELDDPELLYLWDHCEAPIYQTPIIWGPRAAAFLSRGMELPMTQGWESFWDRFVFAEDVVVLYGDSNVHAGQLIPTSLGLGKPAWDVVSLWDAHHDCGYAHTKSLEHWISRGHMTCEDWMLQHHTQGSHLEVTYPAWRGQVDGAMEPEPLVPVDRRVDDGTTPNRTYHAVYVCRSGAWVPPWCDPQFSRFIERAPASSSTLMQAGPLEFPGSKWEHPRPDALTEARQEMEAWRRMEALQGKETPAP